MKRLMGTVIGLLLALTQPAFAVTQTEIDNVRTQATKTPDSPDAQFDLAMAYARTPFLEQGWEALKRIQVLDPGYAAKVVERGEARLQERPDDQEALFRLAFAYYFLDKKDLARRQLERLIAISPNDPWAYNYLGFLSAEANRLDEAFQLWQKALSVDPNNAVSHYLVGQVHYRQGRFMQAAQSLGQAVRLRATSAIKP